jgi:hypothetical protein
MVVTGSLRPIETGTLATRPSGLSAESIREDGYATGVREAGRFLSSTEPGFAQPVAYQWLDKIIAEGRGKLREASTPGPLIEAWDNACRIMFLLATLNERNRDCL